MKQYYMICYCFRRFLKVAKLPVSLVLYVRPSVHTYPLGSRWTDLRETLSGTSMIICQKSKNSVKIQFNLVITTSVCVTPCL